MSKKNNILGQYSLWDIIDEGVKNKTSINKPIRLIEFFSGIGTQFQALHRIGANVESHCISDWDINSNKSYKAMHETLTGIANDYDYSSKYTQEEIIEQLNNLCLSVDGKNPIDEKFIKRKGEAWQRQTFNEFKANNNLGSITQIHADALNIIDKDKYTYMMFYSFPCLVGDTKIITNKGIKNIKAINTDDYVLTHKNRMSKVIASRMTGYKEIFEVKTNKFSIKCTSNHKFYVRRVNNNPIWIEAKDLKPNDYLANVYKTNNKYKVEWIPFISFTDLEYEDYVYDIEVENDHSFVANGCIVHNCTDLSLAGKQMGMKKGSGTRSGLLWEVERILKESVEHELELPDILMMENVPQVCSGKNIDDFEEWKSFLSTLGYSNFHEILNACDYGIPQNRKRCFMVSILDKNATYTFPKKIPLTKCVKDILEQNVDEKYYINNSKSDELIQSLLDRGILPNVKDTICVDGTINKPGERNVANCIPARYDSGIGNLRSSGNMVISQKPCLLKDQGKTYGKDLDVAATLLARDYKGLNNRGSNAVIEEKINVVGQLPTGGQRGRVYDSNGILGTLTATEYKDPSKVLEPSIKVKKNVNQLGNIMEESGFKNPQCGRVYDSNACSPTLNTCGGGNHEPKIVDATIVAMRGRPIDNPNCRISGLPTAQRLEPNEKGISNTITTVTKDNLVLENIKDNQYVYTEYRIRKLTPKECGRLMGVDDDVIDAMSKVNSNSKLYQQFGNSIVVNVLCALFLQLNIQGITNWNNKIE